MPDTSKLYKILACGTCEACLLFLGNEPIFCFFACGFCAGIKRPLAYEKAVLLHQRVKPFLLDMSNKTKNM